MLCVLCFLLISSIIYCEEIDPNKNETISNKNKTNNSSIEMERITRPLKQSQQIERSLISTNSSTNTRKSDFKPSPHLETYYEFNKFPVPPAFPEAKQISHYNLGEFTNQWTTEQSWTHVKFPTVSNVPIAKERPYQFYNDDKMFNGKSYNFPGKSDVLQQPVVTIDAWNKFIENERKKILIQKNQFDFSAPVAPKNQFDYSAPEVPKNNLDFRAPAAQKNQFDFSAPVVPKNQFDYSAPVVPKNHLNFSPPETQKSQFDFNTPVERPTYGMYNKNNFETSSVIPIVDNKNNYESPGIVPHQHEMQHGNTWKKVIKFLTAFIPIGLLISALTPTVITVTSVNGTQSRARAENFGNHPTLNYFNKLNSIGCEDRILCELLLSATTTQNAEQHVENLLNTFTENEKVVEKAEEMKRIFEAVKNQDCRPIICEKIKENT